MARVVIANPDLFATGAAMAAGDAVGTLPASNLLTLRPSQVWRTNGLTDTYFTMELAVDAAIDLFVLVNTNISPTGTVRIRTADSEANLTASPTHDTGAFAHPAAITGGWSFNSTFVNRLYTAGHLAQRVTWAKVLETGTDVGWVRVDINDPSNPDGYVEVGRFIAAEAYKPPIDLALGAQLGVADDSITVRSVGGAATVNRRGRRKTAAFDLRLINREAAYNDVLALLRDIGTSRPIFVCLDPDGTYTLDADCYYGLLQRPRPLLLRASSDDGNRYEIGFEIEEV